MQQCKKCGATLQDDDISIYRKLCDRDAKRFLCRACIAAHFHCELAVIERKIRECKENGCVLFGLKQN